MTPRRSSVLLEVLFALAATGATAHAARRGAPAPRTTPDHRQGDPGTNTAGDARKVAQPAWRYRYGGRSVTAPGSSAMRSTRESPHLQACPERRGHRIRVAVTASNRRGSTRALSRPTVVVVQPPPPPPPPPTSAATSTSASASAAPGRVVMAFDLGWDPTGNMPWSDLTQATCSTWRPRTGLGSTTATSPTSTWPPGSEPRTRTASRPSSHRRRRNSNWATPATTPTGRSRPEPGRLPQLNGFDGIDLDIEDGVWLSQGPPAHR